MVGTTTPAVVRAGREDTIMKGARVTSMAAGALETTEATPCWSVQPLAETAGWLEKWDSFNRANWDTPLLSATLLRLALLHFGHGNEQLAVAERNGRVTAMTLLRPVSRFAWSTFQPSQLPLATFLLARGEALEAVVPHLFHALPRSVLVYSLKQIDSGLIPRPVNSTRGNFLSHMITGAVEWLPTREEYFAARPASLRKNLNNRTRRATKDIGEPRIELLTHPEDVERFLSLYADTESRGWKGRAGTAVQMSKAQGRFYHDLLLQEARKDKARMFVLYFGDVPVAQQLAIEHDRVLYLMKTTYDEAYRQYAPGVLQRQHVLRWAAQCSISRIEIYGRLTESQRPFVTSTREIFHATYFRTAAVRWIRDVVRHVRNAKAESSFPDESAKQNRSARTHRSG